MKETYILMHKDIQCGLIAVDSDSGSLTAYKPIEKEYTPFLGNADEKLMKIWWNHRAVPGSRKDMEDVIRRAGCVNSMGYLAKNLALSLSDSYWICPLDMDLKWDDVNLFRLAESGAEMLEFHNGTSYDPNASLGGQMNKYWDFRETGPVLVKKAYEYYGQQSVNELFATLIHESQGAGIPFVSYYSGTSEDNAVISCCDAFTSGSIEFISAYEVLRSGKQMASRSDFDRYIDVCEEHGIGRDLMQRYMDYLILTDFAISNTDEHLQNFGVMRDSDSMKLIGPAPLFDSGNSMFFSNTRETPLSRVELLKQSISSLHSSEEKMLKHVSDRQIINMQKLPSPEEAESFYIDYGIPESKAAFIAGSYRNKLSLLKDFQDGANISHFKELHSPK